MRKKKTTRKVMWGKDNNNSANNEMKLLLITLILISNVAAAAISMDLKAICNSTSYPPLCCNRLAPIFGSVAGHLVLHDVYTSSVRIAIDELLSASDKLLKLETLTDDERRMSLSGAIRFCRELLSVRAFTALKDSLAGVVGLDDSPTTTTFEDLKTRLTAAGIYHRTCLDAIEDAKDDGRSVIRRADLEKIIKNSTELTSNGLAILHALEKSTGDTDSHSSGDMQLTSLSEVPEKFHTLRLLRFVADVVVAKDGSGNFKRIGDALRVVPSQSDRRVVIYVKAGVYDEIVNVGLDKLNVVMIGDGMDATIVTGNLNSGDGTPSYFSATFTVSGAGFMARDMRFENTAGANKGQAVALKVEADKAIFFRCKISAYQDALLAQAYRQLFYRCDIYGTVDLIFGYSAAVFHSSRILLRKPVIGQENIITAQGKYEARLKSGFSFIGCYIGPAEDLRGVSTFLGRPWKDYSTVVFMYSRIGRLVDPKGWESFAGLPPPDTIYYGERWNTGGGSWTADRVRWKGVHRRMRRSEANRFGVNAFIQGCDWIGGIGIPCSRL